MAMACPLRGMLALPIARSAAGRHKSVTIALTGVALAFSAHAGPMKAMVLAAVAALLMGCSGASSRDDAGGGGWERLQDAPLSPRTDAIVERLGHRVIVVGGRETYDCSGQKTCVPPPSLFDGATYNLETDQWTVIADPITDSSKTAISGGEAVVSGDRLYLLSDVPRRIHEYDAGKDAWTSFPRPPHTYRGPDTWAATDRFVYLTRSDNVPDTGIDRLNLRTKTWTTLPPSPHGPRLSLRTLLPTRGGLVVAGSPVDDGAKVMPPVVERFRNGRWSRFTPAPDDVRGVRWIRTDSMLAAPEGWGRYPGATLDLRTGVWGAVARRPDQPGWSMSHAVGSGMYSSDGFTYAVRSDEWLQLQPPTQDAAPGMGAWVGHALFVVDDQSRTWWLPLSP